MAKTYVGNIGASLILDCKTDVTSATSIKIKVRKPDGVTAEWTAVAYNTNYIKYTIIADDFNIAGEYKMQASFTLSGWTGRGETASLEVYLLYK